MALSIKVQISFGLLLLVLALSEAYENLNYDDYDAGNVRGSVGTSHAGKLRRSGAFPERKEYGRFRRQDDSGESSRHRRQGGGHEGVTGPVHTYVKTDEHAHFKWGVRHHVGHEYAGRR